MKRFALVWVLSVLVALQSAYAENLQAQGQAIFDKALKVMNIRAANAKPFRMQANFDFPEDKNIDAKAIDGQYSETWNSADHWRLEINFPDFQQVEIGRKDKRWLTHDLVQEPGRMGLIREILSFNDLELGSVVKIWNITLKGKQLQCVDSKISDEKNQTACFDSLTGVLILTKQIEFIDMKRQLTSESGCEYSNYQKFGDKMYPIRVVCLADGKVVRQMTMTEMVEDNTPPDSKEFSIPTDGKEWPVCSKLIPPHLVSAPDIEYPRNGSDKTEKTKIQLIVGVDGKPTDMKLTKPGGNPFDYEALKAVGLWKFKPATCGGISVPYQIAVYVEFGRN